MEYRSEVKTLMVITVANVSVYLLALTTFCLILGKRLVLASESLFLIFMLTLIVWCFSLAFQAQIIGPKLKKAIERLKEYERQLSTSTNVSSPKFFTDDALILNIPWSCKVCNKDMGVYMNISRPYKDIVFTAKMHHKAVSPKCSGEAKLNQLGILKVISEER